MRALIALGLFSCLTALACHSNSTTGPISNATSLSGKWIYSAGNLSSVGGGISCSVSGFTLTLVVSGTTLSGNYTGGNINCNGNNVTTQGGALANGVISGSTVVFDLDSPDWHNVGSATTNSMSGNASVLLAVNGTEYQMTGAWIATRE